ncbi:MAG TPA: hypothetical protein VNE18_10360 [Rhodanobacter sp.]|nr:hypothetical protein [Rhodanobacter sp.]
MYARHRNLLIASISACLLLSLTACTPALTVQPSHPVNIVKYRGRPIAPALLAPARLCDVQTGAVWSDVWQAYLCQRGEIKRVNCNLDAIAKRGACDVIKSN